MPRLPRSKPIQPLYTRGGTPIADGFDPLGPGAPTNNRFLTEVQNPNQLEATQLQGGAGTIGLKRGNAGPARSGAFGYGIRSRSFEQYNAPVTDPRSQQPGAPISNRPIVPIGPGLGSGAQGGGGNRPGRNPRALNTDLGEVTSAPSTSLGFRGASLRSPLASVGVRGSQVSGSTVSAAAKVTASPAKATATAAKATAVPTAKAPSKTKKTTKTGSLLQR